MNGHVTLEVECLDRLYLNGYIGNLATPGGLVTFMREQLGKPIRRRWCWGKWRRHSARLSRRKRSASKFRSTSFDHKERKDEVANQIGSGAGFATRSFLWG